MSDFWTLFWIVYIPVAFILVLSGAIELCTDRAPTKFAAQLVCAAPAWPLVVAAYLAWLLAWLLVYAIVRLAGELWWLVRTAFRKDINS